jgi:AcrR family transcriptional regulator
VERRECGNSGICEHLLSGVNKLNQKSKIEDVARKLFWKNGYEKTSLGDIALACGFKKPNIYNHFKSKEELLYDILMKQSRKINEIQNLVSDKNLRPADKIRLLIKTHLRMVLDSSKKSGLLFDVEIRSLSRAHKREYIASRDAYDRMLRNIIQDGIDSGDFAADTDVKIAGFTIISIITRSRLWYSHKGRLSIDEISDAFSTLVLRSLGCSS